MISRAPGFVVPFVLLLAVAAAAEDRTRAVGAPAPPPGRPVGAAELAAASPRDVEAPKAAPGRPAPDIAADLAGRLAVARARWELGRADLAPGSVIPLVGPEGEVLAWDVDLRLDGGSFARPAAVCRDWRERRTGAPTADPTVAAAKAAPPATPFYSVTVSATWDAPPLRASRPAVSNFYAAAPRLATLAARLLGADEPVLERVYPLGSWSRAYEFSGGGRSVVIEGQEPWRWWDAGVYRAASRAHAAWRQARGAQAIAAKGLDLARAAATAQADNRAEAQRWLDGAVAARQTHWIGQSGAFEPFYWYAGCSPTAAAMVLNYYDRRDEGDLGVGLLNRWYARLVSPVTGTDNCRVPELATRLPGYMGTDDEGSTSIFDIRPGMVAHVEERGYCDGGGPDWLGEVSDWHWDGMVNEIDLANPFVWSCNFYPGADTGHSVAVVGCEDISQDLLCHNTWEDCDVPEAVHHSGGLFDWTSIDGVHPSCYASQADLRLTSPRGQDSWVVTAPCGWWGGGDAGCPIPVTWTGSLSSDTRVQIFYSLDAGATWTYAMETEDDGSCGWSAPSSGEYRARLRLDRVRYTGGVAHLVASDGSVGNFGIDAPLPHECVVATDTLRFASADFGVPVTKYFRITNSTCATLSGPFVISGSPEFTVTEPSLYLEPGWYDDIHVTYQPVDCGPDEAVLVFAGTPCASVRLLGQGPSAPLCTVSPAQLDIAFNQVGHAEARTFTVRNAKCGVLAGTFASNDPAFAVSPGSCSLGPGDSLRVTVTFTPASCLPDTGIIDTGPLCQDVVCIAHDVLTPGSWQAITAPPLGQSGAGMGVAAGDYDNDGDDDLYLVRYNQANVLLRNDGGLVFTDVTTPLLADVGPGYGAAWGDCDNDGDLDLYVANYGTADLLLRNNGAGGFALVTGGGLGSTGQSVAPTWADVDGDGDLDLYVTAYGTANLVLRNDGAAGFTRLTTLPLADTGYGMDAAWCDWDRDGDPDLYLVNYGQADKLLRNNGGWNFTEFSNGAYGWDSGAGLGAAWGDIDEDGDLDLFLAKYGQANRLFYNDPDLRLRPATPIPLSDSVMASAAAWADYDLDGDLDLYQFLYGAANRLLRHDGGTAWVNAATGVIANSGNGYGQAWADYDADGRPDVYLHLYGATSLLCQNGMADTSCRNWLRVNLRGVLANRFGLGARITVVAGGHRQVREVGAGEAGMSQGSATVAFGLGAAASVDSVIVRWPWRPRQVHTNLPVNRLLTIVENGAVTEVPDPQTPEWPPAGDVALLLVAPNPFNPSTSIPFDLPREARVTLSVHDVAGRLVRTLIDGALIAPGRHTAAWNGRDNAGRLVGSGVYFCRLEAEGKVRLSKMVLLK